MAILTISRQVGSLGDEIARKLAKELDYKLITRQDFRDLAIKYKDQFSSKIAKIEKEKGLKLWERLMLSTPVYLCLYEAFIYELASQRKVIILGRGAQIVLRDVHQVYRLRVVAPTHARIIHLRQEHGMSTDEALDFIRSHDYNRRNLIRQIYDRDPRDWALYDMILNTSRFDVQAGVAVVKSAIEQVIRLQPLEEAGHVLKGLALGKRVEAKIREEIKPTLEIDVMGEADGTVTISGIASTDEQCNRIGSLAEQFDGVTKVINQVKAPFYKPGI